MSNIVVQACTNSTHMDIDKTSTGHPHLYGGPAGTGIIVFNSFLTNWEFMILLYEQCYKINSIFWRVY